MMMIYMNNSLYYITIIHIYIYIYIYIYINILNFNINFKILKYRLDNCIA